ncbi:MAG: cysteine desulfurase, partial [Candidatus Magasanikbacteria bacterium]|nr:cysteine desulfurase [Candidatus Magasanikbacteria bacterium]
MHNQVKIKKDFQMFYHHPDLVYLDNAATTLTPDIVVEAMNGYYHHYNANIHRGGHGIGAMATERYEQVRSQVVQYIHAPGTNNIVFTSGTTHGMNMLAQGLKHLLEPGDVILLTRMEHHANLLPWQRVVRETGAELRFVEFTDDYQFDMDSFDRLLDERVKIVSITHISNVLGTVVPIKEVCQKAKDMQAITIIDAAQSIAHMAVDVQDIGCDALVFSAHKMYGPTGVGVLYGTTALLEELVPYHLGGGIVREVREDSAIWNDIPARFEAGTPNIAGVIGLGAACEYMKDMGVTDVGDHEHTLMAYAIQQLATIPQVTMLSGKTHVSSVLS